jgi:hypothetical protein
MNTDSFAKVILKPTKRQAEIMPARKPLALTPSHSRVLL